MDEKIVKDSQGLAKDLVNDCISRQVAIDAVDEIESEIAEGRGFEYEKWRKYFCDLPPVQPNEEFEWCHDCKEYDQDAHCCHRWTKAIRKTVEELKATWPEIIRCRECKYGKWDIGDRGMYCGRKYVELGTYEDFFCAAAERREVSE